MGGEEKIKKYGASLVQGALKPSRLVVDSKRERHS